jgi:hypothetical protein
MTDQPKPDTMTDQNKPDPEPDTKPQPDAKPRKRGGYPTRQYQLWSVWRGTELIDLVVAKERPVRGPGLLITGVFPVPMQKRYCEGHRARYWRRRDEPDIYAAVALRRTLGLY